MQLENEVKNGILSGEHLLEEVFKSTDPLITDVDCNLYEGWQFDLNLGDEAFITESDKPIRLDDDNDLLIIKPGSFALLITKETVNMPFDLMGFIAVKFSYKKLGLINISGFHVDPGYKGKLIFSVYNVGPNDILMRRGQPVFSIFFQKLTQDLQDYNKDSDKIIERLSPFEGKSILKNKKFKTKKGYTVIPLEMITSIHGPSKSITMYNDRIERLEYHFKLYGTIAIAVIGALIAVILSK